MGFLGSNLKRGLRVTKENPQLVYTLFTAVVIFLAFLFTSNNFLTIAKDSQDRLVNVRVGSMHDVMSEFAPDYLAQPEILSEKIREISRDNETIREFKIVRFVNNEKIIVSSLDDDEIGTKETENNFLYDLVLAESERSLTAEASIRGERIFKTVRAITDNGKVIGAIYTSQSLSMADRMIERGMFNSIVVLVIVLVLIMMLFFRHAKIIDYGVLYRRLEEINKIKDDFISIATHELRTPLSVIRGYIDMLKSSKKIEPDDYGLLENVDTHSKRLSLLIDDILSVPKIEQGKMEFLWETFSPETEVKETTEALRHNAEEKGLDLSYKINESAPIVADRNKLRQILLNIIGNAIKYTKKGSVKTEISVSNEKVLIRVSDTGIGMSAEEQKGLFQKFYRIRTKETEDVTGTGLGLWITAKLVESMKGTISVEAIKGVGTHFVVSFPIAKEA